jgi:hypothetical protein
MSFAEYFFHYWAMHRGFPHFVYKVLPFFKPILEDHRAHHANYSAQFDYQADPVARELNLRFGREHLVLILIFFAPLLALSVYVAGSVIPAFVFVFFTYLHYRLWNLIHPAMHHGVHPYWTKWGVYKFLARNHFLHHQDSHSRFNIVFPFADYLLEKLHQPTPQELKEIERLGFLK